MENEASNIDRFGKEYSNFFENMLILDVSTEKSLKEKLKRTSMIHINFDKKKFSTVTKDAKITIPDMIGNIGGTLGVFIGFSFLGLLDMMVEFFKYLLRKNLFPCKPK